jgi:hypothetical protein
MITIAVLKLSVAEFMSTNNDLHDIEKLLKGFEFTIKGLTDEVGSV